jgi:hypothetical protein
MYPTLILIPAVFFMVDRLIVVPRVINSFLLQNSFDSFLHEEQEQQWWIKLMPHGRR